MVATAMLGRQPTNPSGLRERLSCPKTWPSHSQRGLGRAPTKHSLSLLFASSQKADGVAKIALVIPTSVVSNMDAFSSTE